MEKRAKQLSYKQIPALIKNLFFKYLFFVNSLFFSLQNVIAQFQSKVEVLEEKGLVSKSETKVEKETEGSNSEQYKPKHHRFDDENDSDSNQNSQGKI